MKAYISVLRTSNERDQRTGSTCIENRQHGLFTVISDLNIDLGFIECPVFLSRISPLVKVVSWKMITEGLRVPVL